MSIEDNLVKFSGRVVDSLGVPLSGVSVRVRASEFGRSFYGKSDSSGVFAMWVPKGSYLLPCLSKSDPVYSSDGRRLGNKIYWHGCLAGEVSTNFEILSDFSVDWVFDPPVALLRQVKVRVLDASGQPAVNADVSVTDVAQQYPAAGSFMVGDVAAGFVRTASYPAVASFGFNEDGSTITSTKTDENGDFTVNTYAGAVNVSIKYLEARTNLNRQIQRVIYTGSMTPQATLLEASNIKPTSVSLKWTYPSEHNPIDATSFVIETSTDSGITWSEVALRSGSQRSAEIENLQPGSAYQFRVTVRSNVGSSVPSNTILAQLPFPAFDPPANLKADLVNSTAAKLTWTAPYRQDGITNYLVDYSIDGGTWLSVKKSDSLSTSLTLSGLTAGAPYRFRVAATNGTDVGEYGLVSFSTMTSPSTPPLNLTSSELYGSSLTLSWSAPESNGGSEITHYSVEIQGGSFSWYPIGPEVTTTSAVLPNLLPGTKYSVRVKAINGFGVSNSSSVLTFKTPAQVPSAVKLTLRSVTTNSASIAWVARSNGGSKITDYLAEYSRDNGKTWKKVVKYPSTSTKLTLRGLKPKTTYLVRISPKNTAGFGSVSNSLKVRTK